MRIGGPKPGESVPAEEPPESNNTESSTSQGLAGAMDALEQAAAANPFSDIGTSAQGLGMDQTEPESETGDDLYELNQARHRNEARFDRILRDLDAPDDIAVQFANDPVGLKVLSTDDRLKLVQYLFDGHTNEEEEDAALTILLSANDDDLRSLVDTIGWEELGSELDEEDVDKIRQRIVSKEDQLASLLQGYDPESGDADDIAAKIANDSSMMNLLTPEDKLSLIKGLFDGNTTDNEATSAFRLLLSNHERDLGQLVGEIGWDELESELSTREFEQVQRKVLGDQGLLDELMKGYDAGSSDADEIATRIASDKHLLDLTTKEQRLQLVRGLIDGPTSFDEKKTAYNILLSGKTEDVKWMVGKLGWKTIYEELDDSKVGKAYREQILGRLGNLGDSFKPEAKGFLDQLGYSPGETIASDESQIRQHISQMSDAQLQTFIKDVLKNKHAVLESMRGEDYGSRKSLTVVMLDDLRGEVRQRPALQKYDSELDLLRYRTAFAVQLAEPGSRKIHAVLGNAGTMLASNDISDQDKFTLLTELGTDLQSQIRYLEIQTSAYGNSSDQESVARLKNEVDTFRSTLNEDSVKDRAFIDKLLHYHWDLVDLQNTEPARDSARAKDFADQLIAAGRETGSNFFDFVPRNYRLNLVQSLVSNPTDEDRAFVLDLMQKTRQEPGQFYDIVRSVGFRALYNALGDDFISLMDGRYGEGISESS